VTDKSDSLVISPNMVKRTVTASAVDQSKGSCLKQNLTGDTSDSLMKDAACHAGGPGSILGPGQTYV
jgi:hypothetical protein